MKNEIVEPSDPRLTAYAVGEMTPAEVTAFERELKNSPAARSEIERIRETAALLREEFGAELDAAFASRANEAIPSLTLVESGTEKSTERRLAFLPEMRTVIAGLAAVLLATAVVVVAWMKRADRPVGESAAVEVDDAGAVEVAGASSETPDPASTPAVAGLLLTAEVNASNQAQPIENKKVPRFVEAASPAFYLASAEADALMAARRFLGDDPILATARILAEDLIHESVIQVPTHTGIVIPATAKQAGGPDISYVSAAPRYGYAIEGLRPEVADTNRYLEIAGQISGDGSGEVSRSLYRVGKSTDAEGNASVRVAGRIQVTRQSDDLVEVEMEGANGERVIGKAREATTDPATGDVILAGGPPTLQSGERVIRPQSEDAKIILKPDGTHQVTGRTGVKFAIKGDRSGSGPKPGASLNAITAPATSAKPAAGSASRPAATPAESAVMLAKHGRDSASKIQPSSPGNFSAGGIGGGTITMTGDEIKLKSGASAAGGTGGMIAIDAAREAPVDSSGFVSAFGRTASDEETRAKSKIRAKSDLAIRGGTFYDLGEAKDAGMEIGAGQKSQSPGGSPVRLEYGVPIESDEFNDQGGKFNFTIGYDFDGVEGGDAPGLVDTLGVENGAQLGTGISMTHATSGLVVPGQAFDKRWTESVPPPAPSKPVSGSGKYARTFDNPFKDPMETALSTFSVDVDTASYTEIRRMILKDGRLPDRDQVRIEEFINYFNYDSYGSPDLAEIEEKEATPFSVNLECAAAPWNPANRIVRIGLKGADIPAGERPAANLVFLLDVSGSMSPEDKLPLMQKCLRELVPKLREDDRITMVVYASKAGEVLEPTPGDDSDTILEAIDALTAKGSTNGEGGIKIAYQRARENFIEDGVNRILLATDGDFNVGQDSDDALVGLIEKEAKTGIELTVLGFGTGNLNDSMLEKITNKGDGQFHYIDRLEEGRRVLVEGMNGSLVTIAKDVKIQVEFNPGNVAAYRLIGYANRIMPREDFNDDTKDAGEIGAGHTVTALYEVVPVEALMKLTQTEPIEDLKYKKLAGNEEEKLPTPMEARRRALKKQGIELVDSPELLTVKLRFKRPDAGKSELLEFPLVDPKMEFADAGKDFRFATAVGAFGEWLRISPASGSWNTAGNARLEGNNLRVPIQQGRSNHSLGKIAQIAHQAIEGDEYGRKKELVEMVKAAARLNGGRIRLDVGEEVPGPEDPAKPGVGESVKEKLKQLR